MGTPSDSNWPDALQLPEFKPTFPKFRGICIGDCCKDLDDAGLDLLAGMMALDPNKRVSATMALFHPYFDSLDKNKLPFNF